jgi:lysozyme family protein
VRYGLKWPEYQKQWDRMKINPSRQAEFDRIAAKLVGLKDKYLSIEEKTGVPWYMIAVIHMREADNDFTKGLAQGDPWNRRSRNKPICGPFSSFEESAIWALKHDGLSSMTDWRLEKQLYHNEVFNGPGYDMRGLPSPYVWGGTNIQKPGKYVADGKFRSDAWDRQPGVAPILASMAKLDPSIKFTRED